MHVLCLKPHPGQTAQLLLQLKLLGRQPAVADVCLRHGLPVLHPEVTVISRDAMVFF